jgi:hypothetical protein
MLSLRAFKLNLLEFHLAFLLFCLSTAFSLGDSARLVLIQLVLGNQYHS